MSAVMQESVPAAEVEVLDRAEITNGRAVVQYSRTEAALAELKDRYKAWGFTALLEGVMVFASNPYLALAGLSILVAINCNSAWGLAGRKETSK